MSLHNIENTNRHPYITKFSDAMQKRIAGNPELEGEVEKNTLNTFSYLYQYPQRGKKNVELIKKYLAEGTLDLGATIEVAGAQNPDSREVFDSLGPVNFIDAAVEGDNKEAIEFLVETGVPLNVNHTYNAFYGHKMDAAAWLTWKSPFDPNEVNESTGKTPLTAWLYDMPDPSNTRAEVVSDAMSKLWTLIIAGGLTLIDTDYEDKGFLGELRQIIDDQKQVRGAWNSTTGEDLSQEERAASIAVYEGYLDHYEAILPKYDEEFLGPEEKEDFDVSRVLLHSNRGASPLEYMTPERWKGKLEAGETLIEKLPQWMRAQIEPVWEATSEIAAITEQPEEPDWGAQNEQPKSGVHALAAALDDLLDLPPEIRGK